MLELFTQISQATTVSEALLPLIAKTKELINCHSCCFFLFQSKILSERDKKNLTIQKTIVQGKFIDVIAINDDEVQSPVFETFDEADYPIFRKKYMSLPIYDSLN
jgi:hypothetical protein